MGPDWSLRVHSLAGYSRLPGLWVEKRDARAGRVTLLLFLHSFRFCLRNAGTHRATVHSHRSLVPSAGSIPVSASNRLCVQNAASGHASVRFLPQSKRSESYRFPFLPTATCFTRRGAPPRTWRIWSGRSTSRFVQSPKWDLTRASSRAASWNH